MEEPRVDIGRPGDGREVSTREPDGRSTPGGGPELTARQRDEREALRALRSATESAPVWFELLTMWVVLGGMMLLLQRFLARESWGTAALFALLWATFFVALWSWAERRRRATRSAGRGAQALELGVITGKEQGYVTVRGERHEVTWRPDGGLGLRVGDPVWAAPHIAPGERIVLIRAHRSFGFAQDVIGARTEAVDADGPA